MFKLRKINSQIYENLLQKLNIIYMSYKTLILYHIIIIINKDLTIKII